MEYIDSYLAKHNFRPEISELPHAHLNLCIVIPCHNEPDLIRSLQSLWNCERPSGATEVIVVLNSAGNSDDSILLSNDETFRKTQLWISEHIDPLFKVFLIKKPDLPEKSAGVGLARKIGMDEAVFRLAKINNPQGVIAGFDADCVCDNNYLTEVEKHFREHQKTPGASVYFEHPVRGDDFPQEIYQGIILYELYLRFLNQALRYAGHPHAFHTVGSAFAVRMESYVKQGGMNKRKAGEDFYFLQKIIALGNFTEINTTRVIPSPRESDRVPFGTGASMKRWQTERYMKTYYQSSFEDLRTFFGLASGLYKASPDQINKVLAKLSPLFREYLLLNQFEDELKSISANSASVSAFINRFFHWFTVFRVIKFLNLSHERFTQKPEIIFEAGILADKLDFPGVREPYKLLEIYRKLDKSGFCAIQQ